MHDSLGSYMTLVRVWLDVVLCRKVLQQQDMMGGDDVDKRVGLRNHRRPIPLTKTLQQLRRMVKSSESTLQRKMSTFLLSGRTDAVKSMVCFSYFDGCLFVHLNEFPSVSLLQRWWRLWGHQG